MSYSPMNSRHRFLIVAGVVVLAGVVSDLAAPDLPARLAMHWDAAGQPDGTMSKPVALALVPTLTVVFLVGFAIIPRIGPLKENIASFRPVYDWFVVVFTVYMTVIHGGIIVFNLGYEFDFTHLILAAVAGLIYLVDIVLTYAERNWFVGIRTPWTLSSDEVWERTNQFGGRCSNSLGSLHLSSCSLATMRFTFSSCPRSLRWQSLSCTLTTSTSVSSGTRSEGSV